MEVIWVFAVVVLVLFLGVALIVASSRCGWRVGRAVGRTIGWVLVVGIGMVALSVGAARVLLPWLGLLSILVGPVLALVVGLALIMSPTYWQNRKTRTIAIVLIVTGLLATLYCIAGLIAMVEAF